MKKGLWRRTGACIAVLALLACFTGSTIAEPVEPEDTTAEAPEVKGEPISGFEQIAENDHAILCLNTDTHTFYVENKATGYRWSSAPANMDDLGLNEYMQSDMMSMLSLNCYNHELEERNDGVSSYAAAVLDENGSVSYEKIDNGFRAVMSFADPVVTIPLQVVLNGDHITASVDTEAIKYDPAKLSLLQMHILPNFGAVSSDNEDAYAVLPDGSGALVYATSNKVNAPDYRKPVFGKDIIIDATDYNGVTLPCFGVSDGSDSLLAVIDGDPADAYVNCKGYDGEGSMYTRPWASFKTTADFEYALVSDYYSTLVFEQGGIKAKTLSVSYYPINGQNNGYADIAAKYRELLFGDRTATKIEAALYMDLYASVQKVRSILGFKSTYNDIVTSTEDVKRLVAELAKLNVDSTVIRYNAWNEEENDGYSPTDMEWDGDIGDVAQLTADMKSKGCLVYPAINRVLTYQESGNLLHTMSDVARDPASRLIMDPDRYLTTSLDGESYMVNFDTLGENLPDLLASADEITSALALSDVVNKLYSDFSEGDHKRPDFVSLITQNLAAYAAANSLMLDAPNGYAVPYANEIINLPTASTGNMMLDEDIPFLQLVYSGMVRYSSEALNMQGSPDASFLKALEYGAMPCYSWIGADGSALINTELDYLFSADASYWMETAAKQYAAVKELVAKTEGSVMASHEKLAEGVYKSTYENGVSVVVNYNSEPYEADGVSVAAMGHQVIGG